MGLFLGSNSPYAASSSALMAAPRIAVIIKPIGFSKPLDPCQAPVSVVPATALQP